MPRDALGRVIPGSYNPDGSVNQAVLQQHMRQQATATGGLKAPATNPALAAVGAMKTPPLLKPPAPIAAPGLARRKPMGLGTVLR